MTMVANPPQSISLSQISLKKTQRGLITGRSGSGKSTLAEFLLSQFVKEYRKARILVVDTKPRFIAHYLETGLPAKKLYRHWDHGANLPNSMLLPVNSDPKKALANVWRHGRIALAQTDGRASGVAWTVHVIDQFLDEARAGRPQLVYVDEGLDFFHSNSIARGGSDAILRCARAGRERGLSLLFGTQRPKGIPVQIRTELTKLYLFALDYASDVKELEEMGYPGKRFPPSENDHIFTYWDKSSDKTRKVAYQMKLKVK